MDQDRRRFVGNLLQKTQLVQDAGAIGYDGQRRAGVGSKICLGLEDGTLYVSMGEGMGQDEAGYRAADYDHCELVWCI